MEQIIISASKYIGAALSGGATALAGALGASIVGKSTSQIIEDFMDYTVFNVQNGYFKDFPDRKGESVIKRMWRVCHD